VRASQQISGALPGAGDGALHAGPAVQQGAESKMYATQANNAIPAGIPIAEGPSSSLWLRLSVWSPTVARAIAGFSFAAVVKVMCMLGMCLFK